MTTVELITEAKSTLPDVDGGLVGDAWAADQCQPQAVVTVNGDSLNRPETESDQAIILSEQDAAIVGAFQQHYKDLGRIAASVLGPHLAVHAEDVVCDAFAIVLDGRSLRNPESVFAYLKKVVIRRSISKLRHWAVEEKNPTAIDHGGSWDSTFWGALEALERDKVVTALRQLSLRRREVIFLRYYLDLTEAEIAVTMGISRGTVKAHAHFGMADLCLVLSSKEEESD